MATASYHHGNLRQALLDHGVALARAGGPDAVVLRDVQRLAGVSNSAAYRHYADRRALLAAVKATVMAQLGAAMVDAIDHVADDGPATDRALARFRATGQAYIDFAVAEPGLFRTAFTPDGTEPSGRGGVGRGPRCCDVVPGRPARHGGNRAATPDHRTPARRDRRQPALANVDSVNFNWNAPRCYRRQHKGALPMSVDTSVSPAQTGAPRRTRPVAILAVVLVAALAINVETTIVNVALPTLNSALGASTRALQWIVDAYNLAFAALVLAGGTIGDRFGRRGTLIAGLILF
ncbi:MAG: TetR family transcriptional regulator, partial [Mycolicibacterium aromaticivorans]|nr:TetR family transcriptional regulator [Mycolicibacterium aromaticivorans]